MFETFSEREKKRLGHKLDVYTYDRIDTGLRIQIFRIIEDALGPPVNKAGYRTAGYELYAAIYDAMTTECQLEHFPEIRQGKPTALRRFFIDTATDAQALDVIDFCFQFLIKVELPRTYLKAADLLNARFRQHAVGYEFLSTPSCSQLIRKDNEHIHRDIIVPALRLLHDLSFAGADEEYRNAHEHYRHGRYSECLTDCLKAFESTMKTIIDRRKWSLPDKQTAGSLIKECLSNGLLGPFMQQHLASLQAGLSSGAPTIRNNLGAHGQGAEIREVPRFYAEYMIHETAVSIVLLVEAFKALPPLS